MTSNYGATFRNSKWTDYTLSNTVRLQHSLEPNTIINPFIFSLILIVLIYFSEGSIMETLKGLELLYLVDFIDTWFSFSDTWLIIIPFLLQGVVIYSFNYLLENILNLLLNFKFDGITKNTPITDLSRGKVRILPFLTSTESTASQNSYSLGSVQTSTLPNLNTLLFKLTGSSTNILPTDSTTSSNHLNPNLSLTQRSNFAIDSLGLSKPQSPLTEARTTRLRSTQVGEFYIHNFNYQKLNYLSTFSELWHINTSWSRQVNLINMLKWSYRYNNLHRRTMYNSHKLTEVKKLLSIGYFDNSSTTNNVWFSGQFGQDLSAAKPNKSLNNTSVLNSTWNLLYGSTLSRANLNQQLTFSPIVNSNLNLQTLSFYEASFHFFTHRLKFFSTLASNTITTSVVATPSTEGVNPTDTTRLLKPLVHELLLKQDSTLNQQTLNTVSSAEAWPTPSSRKDLVLVKHTRDYLNYTTLNILYNTTKSQSTKSTKLNLFTPFSNGRLNNLQTPRLRVITNSKY